MDISIIHAIKDEDNKTIDGTTMGKKALAVSNFNATDEQKNQLLQILQPTAKNPVKYNDIKNLNKDSYTTYFALTPSQRNDYRSLCSSLTETA